MNSRFRNTLLLTAALVLAIVPAQAAVEVNITDSLGTHTYVGIPCGINTCVVIDQSDADFDIDIQIATSNAPNLESALMTFSSNVSSLVASQTLTVEVSDTNYQLPASNASLIQNMDATTPATGLAAGTLVANGYYGTGAGNILFCQETAACSNVAGPINLGSFANGMAGSASTGVSFSPPFSLDEVMTATFTTTGSAQWEGNLSAVPEPAGVALLGGVLLVTFSAFRRKLSRR